MGYIAAQSEVCIVFVSLFLVENWDRDEHPGLRLDKGGEEMIKVVERKCAGEVVVVMHIGGQVIVEDWVSWSSRFLMKEEDLGLTDRSICPRSARCSSLAIRGRKAVMPW